jgi:Xaa-Pro aminopeptidase
MITARFQTFHPTYSSEGSAERLKALRDQLRKEGVHGLLIPRADEHQNEYLPASEERVGWLTGFTGSAGFCIVLMDEAAVLSDGRYTEQLRQQLDPRCYQGVDSVATPPTEWLAQKAKSGQRIGYDPSRMTPDGIQRFVDALKGKGLDLVPLAENAVDALWTNRPAPPATRVEVQPNKLTGATSAAKLKRLSNWLAGEKLDAIVLTDPTNLAWLFNIRAGDVPHMPLPIGYAVVSAKKQPVLFMAPERLSPAAARALSGVCLVVAPAKLDAHLLSFAKAKAKLRFDRDSASSRLVELVRSAGGNADLGANPIQRWKAIKTEAESEGARQAQIRDGAAMVHFLFWLDGAVAKGKVTEMEAAIKLEGFRHATGELKDISFDTISAAGPNAAMPHYRVSVATNRRLTKGIYLIDSGGQYQDGTTDITRTLAIGTPTREMRDRNTRVLKGMIAVSRCVFPKGTTGAQIDALARQALWQAGLEFDHGTGHGVGAYLGVHEGPQRLAKTSMVPLEAGMIVSNEPGYYKPGHYGIRIENLVLVVDHKMRRAERPMLAFETLTFCPIDKRLIDVSLLTEGERGWLDAYHAAVWRKLSPLVVAEAKAWLKAACAPLADA